MVTHVTLITSEKDFPPNCKNINAFLLRLKNTHLLNKVLESDLWIHISGEVFHCMKNKYFDVIEDQKQLKDIVHLVTAGREFS